MQVLVHRHGRRVRPGIEQSVARRLTNALGRLGERVSRIDVRLTRVNGDRKGFGRRCRVLVALMPRGQIVAEATEQRFGDALRRAAQRTVRQIRKGRERHRSKVRYVALRRAA